MLRTRILTAAVALALLILTAWLAPAFVFDLLLLAIACVAIYEWLLLLLVSRMSSTLSAMACFAAGSTLLVSHSSVSAATEGLGVSLLPIYILCALIWLIAVPLALSRFALIGGHRWTGRLVAIVLCFGMWLAMVQADGLGKGFLLSVLLIVWTADTAAYFAGRAFGRTKLAPQISPGKTREGVIGAVLGNLLLAAGLSQWSWSSPANPAGNIFYWMTESIGYPLMLAVTVLLTLVSVMGDLYESLLKRVAKVKDSGSILPGHGGVLDRIDAVIAVLPVAMTLMTLIQVGAIGGGRT